MGIKIVFSEKCLGYGSWHIEGPERVRRAYEILKKSGYQFAVPESAPEEALCLVHDAEYVWKVKKGMVTRVFHATSLLISPVTSAGGRPTETKPISAVPERSKKSGAPRRASTTRPMPA